MCKFFAVPLLFIGSVLLCPLPSECNPTRNLNNSSHPKTHKALTRIESSIERIAELGPLLSGCPFTLKLNQMDNRIPSTFYEIECLHCNKCVNHGSSSKCTQLVTEMEALFQRPDNSTWIDTLIVKAGCHCMPVSIQTRHSSNTRV
ncbi:uncharacterized protein LOC124205696 isoform X1 [Daphnia pulex]|uniref:uncharacterized protein LOC124205696 isoform X1 n=1 Tax=Daphnia pulex TaxID=6669 RepID=UPI001EE154B6|nr:uncharacterized protein LOC124205696 isoform X1 [Daphnia pulex]